MRKSFFIVLASALLLVACSQDFVYEGNCEIENGVWDNKQVAQFEFDVQDTVSLHDFFIDIRNGENYPYGNIIVFVETEFPNGKFAVDTLDCPLADAQGNWYGSGGLGDLYDNRVRYKTKKQFPISGHYKVSIHQALRENPVEGIYDIGFRLAKSK